VTNTFEKCILELQAGSGVREKPGWRQTSLWAMGTRGVRAQGAGVQRVGKARPVLAEN